MMGSRVCIIYFFPVIILFSNILCNENDGKNSTFNPTSEWQKVKDGQAIPQGLHVRINMQTGEKEAKLFEEDKKEKKAIVSVTPPEETTLSPEELKQMLKGIKEEEIKDKKPGKFRSYEELKKDFNSLNLQVKTDIEILTGLIQNFKKFNTKPKSLEKALEDTENEEMLTILVDLEYLVHQYDSAQEFARMNGFQEVIHKSLNSSNGDIRSEALRLHGSATQSNPKVQITALESGSVQLLLKILSFDDDVNVKSRALYALSCLLRRFPSAQDKFLNDGGLTVFAGIFDEEKQDLFKLQIKIITLFHDLLFERKDVKLNLMVEPKNETDPKRGEMKEKLSQYEKMDFERKLVEQGWCKRISNWLKRHNEVHDLDDVKSNGKSSDYPIRSQHDVIEKVIDTVFAMSDICLVNFQSDVKLLRLLNELKELYNSLAVREHSGEDELSTFYSTLSNVLKLLTEKLSGPSSKQKDEL